MPSIKKMGESFALDGRFTRAEAQQIVDKARTGKVTAAEQKAIQGLLTRYGDAFEPGAAELLKGLLASSPVSAPASTGKASPLKGADGARPVFVSAEGSFVTAANAPEPRDNVELGDGLFRAAELVDDAKKNPLEKLPVEVRTKMLGRLASALALAKAGGPDAPGLDAMQTRQLRASAAAVLLALAEASPEPQLRGQAISAYQALARAETFKPLQESMVFNLFASPVGRGEAKAVSDELMKELAPLYPPYETWFKNGNKTVNMQWTIGEGGFKQGFVNMLMEKGFTAAAGPSWAPSVLEKKVSWPGVGETTFRVTLRSGSGTMMAAVGDPNVQVFGYEGHSNWGNNITASVRNAQPVANGGEGQLFFYDLCVGKSGLDKVKDKFPNLQTVTTFASAAFETGADHEMKDAEGVRALLALVDGITRRAPWVQIHQMMNSNMMATSRTWDNYVTPVSTMVREKVLDRDNDGQADYLDRLFDFNTFRVAEDTAREWSPVKQERAAAVLDGTKVVAAGNVINTVSEFNGYLEKVNLDSKVVPAGWFEPTDLEREIVKFEKAKDVDGAVIYKMKVNARYAHASEEALKAIGIYEFNRYLCATHQMKLDPVDAKLNGLLLALHSLDIDESPRDREMWRALLKKYNLPNVSWDVLWRVKEDAFHFYAGSKASIREIREKLPAEVIEALKQPTAGEPS